MPIIQEIEAPQGKTIGDLGVEGLWFVFHTLLAVLILAALVFAMMLAQAPATDPAKIAGAVLAFLVPMVGGFIIARMQRNPVARYVWISGLLLFAAACVWVLDLPTGPGLCEACGAVEKLTRTFFYTSSGSGLLNGEGFLIGTLMPLAMVGYGIGARMALSEEA